MAAHSYNTRAAAAKRLKACKGRRELLGENRICHLPDEILGIILSSLTMKEAGKTSVLSKRWRHLWAYRPTLDFDANEILEEQLLRKKTHVQEERKYLFWVDQVVSLHKAPTLDEFKVRFIKNSRTIHSIDNWVRFAVEKRVKRLSIYLRNYRFQSRMSRCTFSSLSTCNSLTSLELAYINISGEVLEILLSKFIALENLSVSASDSFESLKISSPLLSLKSLRIDQCYNMKRLEISAPNLVSLSYSGLDMHVRLINTPKLAEIFFINRYYYDFESPFSYFGFCLSQVEVLNLHIRHRLRMISKPMEYPLFERLKKLDVRVEPVLDLSLFFLISLITACPFLHHFKLQFIRNCMPARELRTHQVYPHNNLKIVEIVGFVGCAIDLEFALYLAETATSLDKFIVDTRVVMSIGTPLEFKVTKEIRKAKTQAELLRPSLKDGAELVIRGPWAPADFDATVSTGKTI